MSDKRAHDWLDDNAAERLLRGEHDDPRAEALARLLAAAAAPAPVNAQREEAAVAAFRAARAENVKGAEDPARDWRRRRGGALRPGRSMRTLTSALVAAAVLGGVALAAGTGALPRTFGTLTGA